MLGSHKYFSFAAVSSPGAGSFRMAGNGVLNGRKVPRAVMIGGGLFTEERTPRETLREGLPGCSNSAGLL